MAPPVETTSGARQSNTAGRLIALPSPHATFIVDGAWRIVSANATFRDQFDLGRGSVVGEILWHVLAPDLQKAAAARVLRRVMKTRVASAQCCPSQWRPGQYVLLTVVPLEGGHLQAVLRFSARRTAHDRFRQIISALAPAMDGAAVLVPLAAKAAALMG